MCLRHEIIISAFARLGINLARQYKGGVSMALHIGIGNFSRAICSNAYGYKAVRDSSLDVSVMNCLVVVVVVVPAQTLSL